ncbi:cell division protein FtsZ [Pelagovum pacificum]|uniref:Cell division protein FtsZ n=1 Tax=Pelagovum pacificum TaxID=2588711 RepID=A0A5C5G9Q5_9RHOB|nr:cell division protein FtsZ [Pelagovum pacificum]QQA41836.1 cell division protein FtsZ [Pelagovum pacificum]TNY30720.1 cell division protein FtsZ [Pelagovum pacificum]
MTLNLSMPGHEELKPRITVFGVGGAGGNAVNNMIEKQLDGVEFVVANTDAQALQQSMAPAKIQMGVKVTEGLGAGARATVGAAAAEESIEQIVDHLAGAHMCFITAGMGGGTGTGAAPIIAQAARELGVLTVGVVTKPFQFEGGKRMKQAEDGVEALQKVVDTLIIIPNQNLFRLANENTTFTEAFALADDVLYQGVKGVTDLMVRPGLINLDFADVRAVMDEMGKAMMGTGEAEGEHRAIQAAEKAIANPLLDEISLNGAKGVLINITGGYDLTLFELDEAANQIREKVDPEANIIVGSTLDTDMEGKMRVSVVATGIDAVERANETPVPRRAMSSVTPRNAPEPKAAPEPAPVPRQAPAAAAPTPRPAEPAPRQQPEPSLFDDEETASEQAEDIFEDDYADDELPPPAYRPRPEPSLDADSDNFIAPRAPSAGQPSSEAVDRLRAAVAKAPAERSSGHVAGERRERDEDEDRPRFGINSLINRMTGHAAEQPNQRPQPQVRTLHQDHSEPEPDPEQERIEIPAFLRRQAN